MPLDQTALHRPVATLVVSCYWFPQPLVGSTYPRDHVKVAQGLLSCALPQVEVILGEETSVGEAAGSGLTSSGEQGMGDSKVGVGQQKSKMGRSF